MVSNPAGPRSAERWIAAARLGGGAKGLAVATAGDVLARGVAQAAVATASSKAAAIAARGREFTGT